MTGTFKDHFSGHASTYVEARPRYAEALFDWLAAQAPSRALAWDAACGNGQASVSLAARFERVHATDASEQQIAHAEPRPNIAYAVEPAERCSLADRSADLVTIAQALHWTDLARFHGEVRRVLKPGGVIAEWGYSDVHVDAGVDPIKDQLYVDLTGPWWPPERRHIDAGYATLAFPFDRIETPPFELSIDWTLAQFLGYLRSWSASQRYRAARGEDPVSRVEAALRKAWGDASEVKPVRWDFFVRAGRV